MPDASSHRPLPAGSPSGWSEAFAALPAEVAPAGGWERIAPALPVRRRRWPALVALAAAMGLVAVLPLRWSRQDAPTLPVASTPTKTDPGGVAATPRAPAEAIASAAVDRNPGSSANVDAGSDSVAAMAPHNATDAPAAPVQPAAAKPVDDEDTDAAQVAAAEAARPEPSATPQELERLYAESAQLEGLLALARDGGGEVANGAVAMLSEDLSIRVAQIDAALVQPSLDGDRRIALWRERVDALRQAIAFESTQRLLAARGEQYDAMLVSID